MQPAPQQTRTTSPLEMYDIVYNTSVMLGHEAEFIAEFGTREEYAAKVEAL